MKRQFLGNVKNAYLSMFFLVLAITVMPITWAMQQKSSFRSIPQSDLINLIHINNYMFADLVYTILNSPSSVLKQLINPTDKGTILHDIAKRITSFNTHSSKKLFKIIDHLKLNGIDLNAQDANGQTALHVALNNKQFVFAEVLLNKEADPDLQDNNGDNILHILAHKQNEIKNSTLLHNFIIALLQQSSQKVTSLFIRTNNQGKTPSSLFNIPIQDRSWVSLIKKYMRDYNILAQSPIQQPISTNSELGEQSTKHSIQMPQYSFQNEALEILFSQEEQPHDRQQAGEKLSFKELEQELLGTSSQSPAKQGLTIEQIEQELFDGQETSEDHAT